MQTKKLFDHNVIIRGYVHASSVVHATDTSAQPHRGTHMYAHIHE